MLVDGRSTRGRGSFPRRAREHASCGIFCAGKRLVERGDLVPGCGNAEAPEVAFRSGTTFLLSRRRHVVGRRRVTGRRFHPDALIVADVHESGAKVADRVGPSLRGSPAGPRATPLVRTAASCRARAPSKRRPRSSSLGRRSVFARVAGADHLPQGRAQLPQPALGAAGARHRQRVPLLHRRALLLSAPQR